MNTSSLIRHLGLSLRAVAAPMAGGPSTPGLVAAAAHAGSMGFLAGGYLTAEQLEDQISQVRTEGAAVFGVNLFAPNPILISDQAYRDYAKLLAPWARRYGLELEPESPRTDDDHWSAKIAMLEKAQVPVVSVTFGLIPAQDLARLHACGTVVLQTVTDSAEARAAADAGVDGLIAQSAAAGGHSGSWSPQPVPAGLEGDPGESPDGFSTASVVSEISTVTDLPLWAAGGIAASAHLAAVLDAGAEAAVVGTALLCAPEAGTAVTYREALLSRSHSGTTVTTAFSGRPARALHNEFTQRYTAEAPLGFPAVHYLTAPIRRAAATSGDAEGVNLWAGSGFQQVSELPAGQILRRISGLSETA